MHPMRSPDALFVLFLMISAAPATLFSQSKPIKTQWYVEGGAEFGGDKVVEVTFTTGEKQSIRAGQGGSIHVGGQFAHPDVPDFMVRASIGYKYTTTAAENVDLTLTRIPIQATAYYTKENIRVGTGLITHQGITFSGGGAVQDVSFDAAYGTRFEFGYDFLAVT